MLFDAHIHLLPGIGGDPTDLTQTYQMLDRLGAANVRGVLALTRCDPYRLPPHIYRKRCAEKIKIVKSYIKERGYRIRPIFATELLYSPEMHRDFDLNQFLIPKTHYLPFIFPSEPICNAWMRDLSYYISKMRISPIICHFDQQYFIGNGDHFANSSSLIFQISALSLRYKPFAKFILSRMRTHRFIIGSGADIPEILESPCCYSHTAWGLDPLQAVVHERLYMQNNSFRREISL